MKNKFFRFCLIVLLTIFCCSSVIAGGFEQMVGPAANDIKCTLGGPAAIFQNTGSKTVKIVVSMAAGVSVTMVLNPGDTKPLMVGNQPISGFFGAACQYVKQ